MTKKQIFSPWHYLELVPCALGGGSAQHAEKVSNSMIEPYEWTYATPLPISFKHLNMTLKFWMFLLYLLVVWDGLHISTVIHGQCEVEDIRNEVLCWDYRRPISLNEHMHCISEGIHIPALLRCCWFHSSASLAVALTRVSSFKSMRSDCAKYSRSIRSI